MKNAEEVDSIGLQQGREAVLGMRANWVIHDVYLLVAEGGGRQLVSTTCRGERRRSNNHTMTSRIREIGYWSCKVKLALVDR